jgi:putative spermidine/putrescine transport system permease protein
MGIESRGEPGSASSAELVKERMLRGDVSSPVPVLRHPVSWAWVGLLPFFLFALAFLIAPAGFLFVGTFQDARGSFTLDNLAGLFQPFVLQAYWLSLEVSAITAIGGGIFGFLLAYAAVLGGLPRAVRSLLLTFSGVASNFAGLPLAFAFIATLGRTGAVTVLLKEVLRLDLYGVGFNLYSLAGLSLTYVYFQFPLMILIITPALDGLRREWREAAESLGATPADYWRRVALPILAPSIVGAMILLFGNAFGAYATAFALTGGTFNFATILIGAELRGDVLHNPGLGYAVALGMVLIMGVSIAGYAALQRQTARWVRT